MKLAKITEFTLWIKGTAPLPAGAVPLAAHGVAGLVCLMPSGRWISWLGGVAKSLPLDTQKEVMEVLISQMGGTAATMAEKLGVSKRTVESWRSRKSPLPISKGFEIAEILSA
jgi:DNA-binding XRE family transcriptional regulator